ncbi:KpsF/GutQ family sugar-phosphate isomerase [Escherichia coli]|mgnify:FL=1|uniref:KpsF/GutQ family sugar-phosphate isomerase n=1 Tax=Escherichia coli TaxID=562 RepID=UPI00025C7862|nr:KpsF/GutQ family sugar-phosphate isomerase [Escherichia coli]EFT1069143.1 KpsF/GutQ family sugar-phosphate isomerase [Shigella sonnei]ELP2947692.1 KpsF/GutQ family sugar-phosphate isomerase [Escherichia coli O76]HBC3022361.1 KpsF/GutQ family sugar-phosphate isomerase [Escherichia coli O146]HDQ6497214.1 KpsF/GutQ family sugar-phosphate isomerase [Escherichia coli O117:H4]HDQ6521836.1 KpsF/GutQ family sugar-phosphate isomerase [Escherichia coli O113:H4]
MPEKYSPDDQSSTIDPYLITSVRQTLEEQGAALQNLSKQLDSGQYQCVLNLIMNCKGHVILSGMGKSGHVGRKMSATLASTGIPSFFIHPAEAFHGDLGMITPCDLLILISASGETDEILKLVPSLKNFGNRIIAITNNGHSTLAKNADAVLELHMANETCPNNLAPTTSTTLTMAIGDALAIAMIHKRKFMPNDFARYHPGGSLGRRLLTRVADVMQHDVPAVQLDASFKTVIQRITSGCQGMVMVEDAEGGLAGIITDGDLRRFMEKEDSLTSATAAQMMTREPLTLPEDTMIIEAEEKMQKHRVSTLLVTNKANKVTGLVRIFD